MRETMGERLRVRGQWRERLRERQRQIIRDRVRESTTHNERKSGSQVVRLGKTERRRERIRQGDGETNRKIR